MDNCGDAAADAAVKGILSMDNCGDAAADAAVKGILRKRYFF